MSFTYPKHFCTFFLFQALCFDLLHDFRSVTSFLLIVSSLSISVPFFQIGHFSFAQIGLYYFALAQRMTY